MVLVFIKYFSPHIKILIFKQKKKVYFVSLLMFMKYILQKLNKSLI